jgi:hypothetical protein
MIDVGQVASAGSGKHIYDLVWNQVPLWYKLQAIHLVFYWVAALFIKLSILSLCKRYISHEGSILHGLMLAVASVFCLLAIIAVFITIFCFNPASAQWNLDRRLISFSSLNQADLVTALQSLYAVGDVIVLIFAAMVVATRSDFHARRLPLAILFLVGSGICAMSLTAAGYSKRAYNTYDPVWNAFPFIICQQLELSIAAICACLPLILDRINPVERDVNETNWKATPKPEERTTSSGRRPLSGFFKGKAVHWLTKSNSNNEQSNNLSALQSYPNADRAGAQAEKEWHDPVQPSRAPPQYEKTAPYDSPPAAPAATHSYYSRPSQDSRKARSQRKQSEDVPAYFNRPYGGNVESPQVQQPSTTVGHRQSQRNSGSYVTKSNRPMSADSYTSDGGDSFNLVIQSPDDADSPEVGHHGKFSYR